MQINITDSINQTVLFTLCLLLVIIATTRKDKNAFEMNQTHTGELKGIAILMVLFSHIGYFLSSDSRFLFPLSVASGVGVNMFLFLSGFGLTKSALKKGAPIMRYYLKRFKSIFLPMWLVLVPTLILDASILRRFYGFSEILSSILGYFPKADLMTSINSPLWYFSLILFYYLIFPLIFWKKYPLVSAIIILLVGFAMTKFILPVHPDVLKLYQLHFIAFPLGMVFAWFFRSLPVMFNKTWVRLILVVFLLVVFGYTAIHSGVGSKALVEQSTSLISMLSLLLIIILIDVKSGFLILLGKYSYEIYLVQWPLMSRFDFIYKHTPPFLATILYICLFMGLGFILQKLGALLTREKT